MKINKRINVNKPYLPSKDKYFRYIERIWENNHLTNFGPLSIELEDRLRDYLGVKNILLVGNGTLALQIAYKVLGIKNEVITTPFSFAATANTLIWENLKPRFCDIDEKSFCIDVCKIERLISKNTSAILPVHTFGNICDIESLQNIADRYNLKLIFDAAHAFGVKYKNKSVFCYGDISAISFHSTKIFHSVEGGALVSKNKDYLDEAKSIINFGLKNNIPEILGINAKNSEFHAAMGLCILDDIDFIMEQRREIWEYYFKNLKDDFDMQILNKYSTNNYHYFPILFKNEDLLLNSMEALNNNDIFPRRYFYPSLDKLPYVDTNDDCKISQNIASRILCLPLYVGLDKKTQDLIIKILKR